LPIISTVTQQRKKYYAVFKFNGKTKWIPLDATDRELAGRKVKEGIAKHKKTDPKPIRQTPTWDQFLAIVDDIRTQKFNADAKDSADLAEFMGRAGVGTAECANLLGEPIDFAGGRITLCRKKIDIGYTIPVFRIYLVLFFDIDNRMANKSPEPFEPIGYWRKEWCRAQGRRQRARARTP
jgi:hypothetical protein